MNLLIFVVFNSNTKEFKLNSTIKASSLRYRLPKLSDALLVVKIFPLWDQPEMFTKGPSLLQSDSLSIQ
jgi:hypothetical protein